MPEIVALYVKKKKLKQFNSFLMLYWDKLYGSFSQSKYISSHLTLTFESEVTDVRLGCG